MKQKVAYPQVGQTLASGYTVMANYDNRCVLAHSETAPEPYAVWYLDRDGDTINGSYRSDLASAQRRFAERCFSEEAMPWSSKQLSQAFEKVIEKFSLPPSQQSVTIPCIDDLNKIKALLREVEEGSLGFSEIPRDISQSHER